jgi:hypothetical protein
VFQRVNQKCIQYQGHQNDSPNSSVEMPSHIQRKFILFNGGLELFHEWLVESIKSLEVIGENAPLSRLLIPLVELLNDIPVDFDLVFKTGINKSIGDLYRLIKRQESTLSRKFFSELYALLSQLKNHWSELKKNWKSPIEKSESQNTSGSCNGTNPFASLIDLMMKQYEILCECEEHGKSTPWDNQVSKILPPKPNVLPFSGKTLIRERLEEKQRLRETEQRKAEETRKSMRHKTLGALISKTVSNHHLVKEKFATAARRVHTADNNTADAPRKKRVSFADEKKT